MQGLENTRFGMILSTLLLAGIAVAAFPLLFPDGLVSRLTTLDLHNVAPWISTGAVFLLFSRIAAIAGSVIETRLSKNADQEEGLEEWLDEQEDDEEATDQQKSPPGQRLDVTPSLKATEVAQGVLVGAGWATIVSGLLMAIASIPAAISAHPGVVDPETLYRYLGIFGSLIKWVLAAGVFYGILRVLRAFWPGAKDALPYPFRPLVVFGVAYLLLAGGGILEAAFDFPGGLILIIVALALALPYLSSVVRGVVALPLPTRIRNPARILLLLTDIGWIVLVLGIMLTLPGIVDGIPELQEGGALGSVSPYLDILDTLSLWSVVLLTPFIIVRAVASFRPAVGEVFGFPMGRIVLFAFALIGFSGNGVPATASNLPIPHLMPAMAAALFISYLAMVLRRVAQLGLPPRIAVPMTNIPPLVGSLMPAISVSLVVWALLQFSPLINAPLLDGSNTSSAGETALPYFAGLFDVRLTLTAFVFVVVFTLSLPDPLWTPARLRVRPMLAAVGFSAASCLLWLSLAPLSGLGHVFPLLGAIIGAGLITLGISQLATYLTDSREIMYSGPSRWLASSKARGFIVGAAIAFYGMLLRPLVYETLWFAAVYEWLVVFAVAIWALFKIRGSLKSFVETAEAAPLNWTGWNRHEQRFEDRPDPRRILVSRWQRRFVESGEWASLWTYLMGLLCRNNASPQSVQEVFRPLREAVVPQPGAGFLRRRGDKNFRRREASLAASLRCAEQALSNTTGLAVSVDASTLSECSGPFIENGADSEVMAANVVSAYRRRGADANSAVTLWFPLVNVVDAPPKWFQPPWVRSRTRRSARDRRRRLVEGAISHLSGETTAASLSVGVAARNVPLVPIAPNRSQVQTVAVTPQSATPEASAEGQSNGASGSVPEQNPFVSRIVQHQMTRASFQMPTAATTAAPRPDAIIQGQGFELINETSSSYLVRTSENVVGHVSKSALLRLPILPGDEVIAV